MQVAASRNRNPERIPNEVTVLDDLPQKIIEQIEAAGLPTTGDHPFHPKTTRNRNGDRIIEKRAIRKGPKAGKKGFVDDQDQIWIRDRAHAHVPDHWDVQIDDGDDYFRVGLDGNRIL
jgi:hypothetical protein